MRASKAESQVCRVQDPLSSLLARQDTERFQARSRELEKKLSAKEQELERLTQKQSRVG